MKDKFEQPNINNTLLYRVENNMKDFPKEIFQYFNTDKYTQGLDVRNIINIITLIDV